MTQEQIDEVITFETSLSENDEWLFWNISALRAIDEGGPVTFEDKYRVMEKWDRIMAADTELEDE